MISDMISLLDVEFDFLVGHCRFIKKIFHDEQKSFTEKFQKALAETTVNQERFYEYFGNEHYYVNELFPGIQWSAMFVLAFNLFEKSLNDMCSICKTYSNLTTGIELKDIEGKGIEKAKKYLSKVHGLTDTFSKNEWRKIKIFSKIRNVLTHTYGELDLNQKNHRIIFDEIRNHKTGITGIRIERYDQSLERADIVVEENFVFQSIKIYRDFIKMLSSEIKDKY
ncbi:MAG: hypothetical protein J7K85_04800 [Anaerolineaceae bacterium]|nr:hypothetical protein [Anaerolineaceae bacterium]